MKLLWTCYYNKHLWHFFSENCVIIGLKSVVFCNRISFSMHMSESQFKWCYPSKCADHLVSERCLATKCLPIDDVNIIQRWVEPAKNEYRCWTKSKNFTVCRQHSAAFTPNSSCVIELMNLCMQSSILSRHIWDMTDYANLIVEFCSH